VVARLREDIAPLGEDRYLAPDLKRARALIASGALIAAAQIEMPDIAL
jgi:histidine ammonia-lyase